MKIDIKNIDINDVVLGRSSHGYGLCLLKRVECNLDYGYEFLNLFSEELEFHHLNDDVYFWVDNSADIETLISIYKG